MGQFLDWRSDYVATTIIPSLVEVAALEAPQRLGKDARITMVWLCGEISTAAAKLGS